MTRILILSGGGAYRDPWHPFALTSARLQQILDGDGHHVEITEDVAAAVADLSGWDLIVANASDGPPETDTRAAGAGLDAALDRGVGVLAVHVGVGTLARLPAWASVTGAKWINGESRHPKTGPCTITTYPGRHPIVAPVGDFEITDERYSFLRVEPGVTALADHEWEGARHPLLWAREHGRSRVVVDALGHDERSYDSAGHREIIVRAARWLSRGL
jgi:hypothetical protein